VPRRRGAAGARTGRRALDAPRGLGRRERCAVRRGSARDFRGVRLSRTRGEARRSRRQEPPSASPRSAPHLQALLPVRAHGRQPCHQHRDRRRGVLPRARASRAVRRARAGAADRAALPPPARPFPAHRLRLTRCSTVDCARQLVEAFASYNAQFRAITRRAPLRFDSRDWKASQRDAVERIELYDRFVYQTIAELRAALGGEAHDRERWRGIPAEFAALIGDLPDPEFTKTFFSSVTRRLFCTVGVAPDIEFVATDLDPLAGIRSSVGTNTYANHGSLPLLFEDLLGDVRFRSPWRDLDKSIAHVAAEVRSYLDAREERRTVEKVEVIRPVFYQVARAYIVGRIMGPGLLVPLVIALKNTDSGMLVDAVMLAEDDVSIVFGYTRSYYHVDLERVAEAVMFLRSVMPKNPVSELFTVLGRARQGKTERYRELV